MRILRDRPGLVEAEVARGADLVVIDWTRDSAFRFFPLIEHDDFGLVLQRISRGGGTKPLTRRDGSFAYCRLARRAPAWRPLALTTDSKRRHPLRARQCPARRRGYVGEKKGPASAGPRAAELKLRPPSASLELLGRLAPSDFSNDSDYAQPLVFPQLAHL